MTESSKAIFLYMARLFVIAAVGTALMSFAACSRNGSQPQPVLLFDSLPQSFTLQPVINEVSGIADSKANPGYLWGIEDSGNPPQLYLISHDGAMQKIIPIKDASNRDWEEMKVCDNELYIAETGDNAQVYGEYRFYRFGEPSLHADTVRQYDVIRFQYPDGSHDAEAFIVDPATKDIYIWTKRDIPSRLYRLSFPYSTSGLNAAEYLGAMPYTGIVGAALSPDSREIILKTYASVHYYQRANGESIADAVHHSDVTLPYRPEPQGEAVSFAQDNSGFFTLSERMGGPSVQLFFYRRK